MTVTSITLRSARHHLADLDYEQRIIGGLLRDYQLARVATGPLTPEHFAHPSLGAILRAIRSVEAEGETPSIPVVRDHLGARRNPAAVPLIAHCFEHYIPSADRPRLHLFVGRILALARLRWLLTLADRVDSVLGDRRLDESTRIEVAHKAMREALAELGGETERLPA